MRYLCFLTALVFLSSCKTEPTPTPAATSTFAEGGINAIIEIPAGTNHKIEYDYASETFKVDQENGKDRIINFLPYPGNYGFIPGTLMDRERGGDGDALDILVLSESLPTGTAIGVIPIAAIELSDRGELDTKIIAIPLDSTLRIIQATNFVDFMIEYNIAQTIIKDWFLNYKGLGVVELIAWKDEKYAMSEIEKWKIKTPEMKE